MAVVPNVVIQYVNNLSGGEMNRLVPLVSTHFTFGLIKMSRQATAIAILYLIISRDPQTPSSRHGRSENFPNKIGPNPTQSSVQYAYKLKIMIAKLDFIDAERLFL